jgi:hypothetical protein
MGSMGVTNCHSEPKIILLHSVPRGGNFSYICYNELVKNLTNYTYCVIIYKEYAMIIEEGNLRGVVAGFRNKNTVFEFLDGQKWIQAEYRKNCRDSFMPHARIRDIEGRYYIEIEGINDTVEVKRAGN